MALDVNNDRYVSSIDALQVLNSINSIGSRRLSYPTSGASPPPYLDVNGDSFVSAIDALFVMNEINRIAQERRAAAAASTVSAVAAAMGGSLNSAAIAAALDALEADRANDEFDAVSS